MTPSISIGGYNEHALDRDLVLSGVAWDRGFLFFPNNFDAFLNMVNHDFQNNYFFECLFST